MALSILNKRRRRLGTSYLRSATILCVFLSTSMQLSSAQTTTSAPFPSSLSNSPTTLTTSFTQSSTINPPSDTDSATSPPARPTSNDNAPDTSGPDADAADDSKTGLINYYFVFLAFFVALVFVGVYFAHKRRRARKARARNSGQNALARDLDGWTSTRRWMNGHWRQESRASRDEGLNELGQPPPPYVAKLGTHGRGPSAENAGEPRIPLRTLTRDEMVGGAAKPPEYSVVVREDTASSSHRDEARPITPLPSASELGNLNDTTRH